MGRRVVLVLDGVDPIDVSPIAVSLPQRGRSLSACVLEDCGADRWAVACSRFRFRLGWAKMLWAHRLVGKWKKSTFYLDCFELHRDVKCSCHCGTAHVFAYYNAQKVKSRKKFSSDHLFIFRGFTF